MQVYYLVGEKICVSSIWNLIKGWILVYCICIRAFEIELQSFRFEWFKPCTAVGAELSFECKFTIKSNDFLEKKKQRPVKDLIHCRNRKFIKI